MPQKQVTNTAPPSNVVGSGEINPSKLYGIKHKKFARTRNPKKYKLHQRADTGEIEAIGFLNSTGHLNEANKFTSLLAAFEYCQEKGHTMYQFDTPQEMGEWLNS